MLEYHRLPLSIYFFFYKLSQDQNSNQEVGHLECFRKLISDRVTALKTFDWYFMPDGKFARCWEYFILFVTISIGIIYPYLASFMGKFKCDPLPQNPELVGSVTF